MPSPPSRAAADAESDRRDADLLGRWRDARDEASLHELIVRHRPMVEAVCRRIMRSVGDPEDAVQETLIALSAEAGDIRERPGAWLRRVATNRALMQVRQHQRRRLQPAVEPTAPPPAEDDAEAEELLRACLAEIDEADRELLVRLFWLGETQAAIARGEGVPRVYVHRRQQRALDRLRTAFARRGVRIAAPALALLLAGGDRALAAAATAALRSSLVLPAISAALVLVVLVVLGALLSLRKPAQLDPAARAVSEPATAAAPATSATSAPPGAAAAGAPRADRPADWASAVPDGRVARLIATFDPARLEIGIVAAAAPQVRAAAAATGAGSEGATTPSHNLHHWDREPSYEVASVSPWADEVRLPGGHRGLALRPPPGSTMHLRSCDRWAMLDEGTTIVMVLTTGGHEGGPARATCANLLVDGEAVLFERETPYTTAAGIGRWRTWQRMPRTAEMEEIAQSFVMALISPTVLVGFEHRALSPAERAALLARCPGQQGEVKPPGP
ncbi:MAG: sigma-70 family RNA polymerase sigma factor [Planctomycetes bacterium]|nr:sigma-70 family RNA polymerase sigma factor [Planctomycetota bacterium]